MQCDEKLKRTVHKVSALHSSRDCIETGTVGQPNSFAGIKTPYSIVSGGNSSLERI